MAGGKKAGAPKADPKDTAGRLGVALDRFLQQAVAADPDLDPAAVLSVLLRITAGRVAEIGEGAPSGEVLRALDLFIDQEREARGKTEPPPSDRPGAG